MLKLGSTKINDVDAVEGIWHEIMFRDDGEVKKIRMKLALANLTVNKTFTAKISELTKPHQKAIELGVFDGGLEIEAQAYAHTILRDWEGVVGEDDRPLPYTPEAGAVLFAAYPEVFDQVKELAKDAAAYRRAVVKGQAGN